MSQVLSTHTPETQNCTKQNEKKDRHNRVKGQIEEKRANSSQRKGRSGRELVRLHDLRSIDK